ncbi:MAG: type III pantothenate kinase [Planctomycetota bacterium]
MIARFNREKASLDDDRPPGLVVLDIGNSSLHVGLWSDRGVADVRRLEHGDRTGLAESLTEMRSNSARAGLVAAVVACVVPDALSAAEESITQALELQALVIGRDLPLPMAVAVHRPETVGVDRMCAAAAAYEKVRDTCTVIDFGTAVTVDLVDEAGVFQGGAILPGLWMQAHALGNHTAVLPVVSTEFPDQPVGKDTTEAIRSGICHGLVGAVRNLVEEYATRLNRWPYVVATGGDAAMMVAHCDFIDKMVPDLCLCGVGLAYVKYLNAESEET